MAWIYLVVAGIFEVVWATFMKMSDGFRKPSMTTLTIIGMVISFICLAKATHRLPMSIAYPLWTGIGAVGSVVIGVTFFGDRLSGSTWFFVGVLLIGIIGLKITSH